MNQTDVLTVIVSVLSSGIVAAFFAGTQIGKLKSIDKRLQNIEGLFQLQLRQPSQPVNVYPAIVSPPEGK